MVVRKRETHTETNQQRNTVHKCRQSACIGIHIQLQLRQIPWRKSWSTDPSDWCGVVPMRRAVADQKDLGMGHAMREINMTCGMPRWYWIKKEPRRGGTDEYVLKIDDG